MKLKLEEGKYYRNRSGRKVGPMVWSYGDPYSETHPWMDSERRTYRNNGQWSVYAGTESNYDIIAEWIDEPEMQPETGTLAELNVKPGDVVEDGTGFRAEVVMHEGRLCVLYPHWNEPQERDSHNGYRIVARAAKPNEPETQPDTPKLWRDMTPEEKGALLLAYHEGKVIEWWTGGTNWRKTDPEWEFECAYRIRPEPKRRTQRAVWTGPSNPEGAMPFHCGPADIGDWIITFEAEEVQTEDGTTLRPIRDTLNFEEYY